MVYLIEEDGLFHMPKASDSLPFKIEQKTEMRFEDNTVIYCSPYLEEHPFHWHHKDVLPGQNNVAPLVRMAVNRTLPRVVCEAVIIENGNLLLVKPSRGFNKGHWTLPGGFVSYGEPPEEAVIREVKEEVGAESELTELLGVETFVGRDSYFTWHMFFFKVALLTHHFDPPPDEIEEVRWFELSDGLERLYGIKKLKLSKYLLAR